MSPLHRLSWLLAIAGDKTLPPTALHVATALSHFVNKVTGDARPSKATLAALINSDERRVRRMVSCLQLAGWLNVSRSSGRSCCTYTPINPDKSTRVEPGQPDPGLINPTRTIPPYQPGQKCSPTRTPRPPEQGEQGNEQGIDTHIKKFIRPKIEEVAAYCEERGNAVDPEKWHDHYSANGWMVGRNRMSNWQAAVRTWERGDNRGHDRSKTETELPGLIEREVDADQARELLGIKTQQSEMMS